MTEGEERQELTVEEWNGIINFKQSSHAARWILSKDVVEKKRAQLREKYRNEWDRARQLSEEYTRKKGKVIEVEELPPYSAQDEARDRWFVLREMQQLCRKDLPPEHRRIEATALYFLHRFFVQHYVHDYSASQLVPVTLSLAAKVEEVHVDKAFFANTDVLIRLEIELLSSLRFSIHVHSPLTCLAGLLLAVWPKLMGSVKRPKGIKPSSEHYLSQIHLTDAPLLFSPSAIALAAMSLFARDLEPKQQADVLTFVSRVVGAGTIEGHEVTVAQSDIDGVKREWEESMARGANMKEEEYAQAKKEWKSRMQRMINPLRSPSSPLVAFVEEVEKERKDREKVEKHEKRKEREGEGGDFGFGDEVVLLPRQSQSSSSKKHRQ
eukprot:CAMPEP_0113898424 /NCGR_PEP_ID=MMETSP0780_2-20120614/19366_1 /TAXON_ID=652834 /ORGANISM="Palpitomonas bilix" /LENGTH=379 /DNA_ID=CAMNT_0000890275 /DNA_START=36 /DNA_END=1175 /DNA_ORIENTATION=+ /assembly_acc=CAM_ASM_000599